MPRRPVVPQESLASLTSRSSALRSAPDISLTPASGLAPVEAHTRATRVLTQAQQLLAQTDTQRGALQQCLARLHTAEPDALFFYRPAPATLTPAPGPGPKARKARRLQPRLTTALREVEARLEAIRLNALLAISRLGVRVALWHFLIPGPLPPTVDALRPRAAPPPPPVSSSPQETTPQRSHPRGAPHTHPLP